MSYSTGFKMGDIVISIKDNSRSIVILHCTFNTLTSSNLCKILLNIDGSELCQQINFERDNDFIIVTSNGSNWCKWGFCDEYIKV